MKSAYELAMERLSRSEPQSAPLTDAQKARLAEVDRVFKGKWAEREIFLKGRLNAAHAEGKLEEIEKIQRQLVDERARLDEERDAEKDLIRARG